MELKTVFFAKTNLNVDGRIINQIRILFNANVLNSLDFILIPDKPYSHLIDNVKVHIINSKFRNKSIFRFFTVIDTTFKSLKKLYKINPQILHVQDTAVVLPSLIFKFLKGEKLKLIYDDHELPNENESFQYRIYQYLEKILMKNSDLVIFANEERMKLLVADYKLATKVSYFLNLPYFEENIDKLKIYDDNRFSDLDNELNNGMKFIMHQGSLEVERGRLKLANFSKILPLNFKILIVGVSIEQFNNFLKEYKLDSNKFYFFGVISYTYLDVVWSKCEASIVMYLPTYINNRLCAPNRLYISLKHNMPVIINKDNPVLNAMVEELNCGYYIEDFSFNQFNLLVKKDVFSKQLHNLIIENKSRLINLYNDL